MRTKILSLALITALSCGCISSLSYAKDEESFIVEDEQFQKTETENEVQETFGGICSRKIKKQKRIKK